MSPLVCIIILTLSAISAQPNNFKDQVFTGLNLAYDYILENYGSINIDGLFGVVFSQAHLTVLLNGDLDEVDRENVAYLKGKADKIYKLTRPLLYQDNSKYNYFVDNVLVPKIWLRDIDFVPYKINRNLKPNVLNTDTNTYEGYMGYLKTSKISEKESDKCIMELLRGGPEKGARNCTISEECRFYMVEDKVFDPMYGITHRLLYLQIAKSQNCNLKEEWYNRKVRLYCSYIFWEAKQNANFGFIDKLDDLFLEQVTLCGFEGFSEFFQEAFIEHVLEIQTEHGCFLIPSEDKNSIGDRRIMKRDANIINNGCNDHTTGLGVSSLSLILRYLLKQ